MVRRSGVVYDGAGGVIMVLVLEKWADGV